MFPGSCKSPCKMYVFTCKRKKKIKPRLSVTFQLGDRKAEPHLLSLAFFNSEAEENKGL